MGLERIAECFLMLFKRILALSQIEKPLHRATQGALVRGVLTVIRYRNIWARALLHRRIDVEQVSVAMGFILTI